MAKRKAKKTTTRRRRRISGIGGGMSGILQTAGAVTAGAAAGNFLGNFIAGKVQNPKIVAAAVIAAGIFAPKLIKSAMGQSVGHGLIAVGGIQMLKALNVPGIAGFDETVSGFEVPMAGIDDDGMSGTEDDGSLSGLGYSGGDDD